jgi:D-arabinose 1-dehydrogenase-like Zn-dependent alcohol dehydrogenase
VRTSGAVAIQFTPEELREYNDATTRITAQGERLRKGLLEIQELLDFCGKHGITSDVEMINIQNINEAYDRMLKSDVKYRFVIDMASLKVKSSK